MQKLRLQNLITVSDLFCNFNLDKLHGKGNIKRKYKCADKRNLSKKIFMSFMRVMITEFLQGGQVFLFPGRIPFRLQFRRMRDSKFKHALKGGRIPGLDVLMAQFKYYEPILSRPHRNGPWDVPMKVSAGFRDIVTERVNEGFKYC